VPKRPTIWLSSYTQLRRHKHLLKKTDFGHVVLDEAQHIKNPEAKVTQACFSIQSRYRLILTGTPVENTPLDLWTLFRFLMPGLLGGRKAFEEGLSAGENAFLETLRAQIEPFTLRRTKQQVAQELPEKVEAVVKCPLSESQRAEYSRIIQQGVQELGDDVQDALNNYSINFLSLLTRLRQVCTDPGLLPWNRSGKIVLSEESGKIREFLRRMDEILSRGHKVVVFSQFVTLLRELRPLLEKHKPGTKIFELYGDTRERGKVVKSFQSRKGGGVILVSLRAGGTGITLHAADYVFLMDPWWNPAVEKQAVDRVHRIGQKKTVFVYRMIAAGTIEERIQDLKAGKEMTFRELIGALENKLQDNDEPFLNLRRILEVHD
jgi:SNF2 family DNA or RNA helicase